MAKIILTVDGTILKELPLTKERTTIGRRSSNDLVIDHVAISGEHAAIVKRQNEIFIEDLNSTNGTHLNGQPIKIQLLKDNDIIELPPYKLRLIVGSSGKVPAVAPQLDRSHQRDEDAFADVEIGDAASQRVAMIQVLDGPSAGKEILLTKPLTTVGRPGIQVAVLTYRKQGHVLSHVEGRSFPLVNGESIGANARLLEYDDVIDLSGTRMLYKRAG